MTGKHIWRMIACGVVLAISIAAARAQEGLGPFMPHEGGLVTTAWANAYGPDAESYIKFTHVTPDSFDIKYTSSRGIRAVRRIRVIDRINARALVLGFSVRMPLVIENTTTVGTSTVVLEELRTTGHAASALIYNASMDSMQGGFTLIDARGKFPIVVDNTAMTVPVLHASGLFTGDGRQARGDFYFLNNKNNPMLLQYSISFTGEDVPRTETYVRVTPGAGERSKMEQALNTMHNYTTYGIHFDFDKATIQNESVPLINEMVATLKNNPLWTLRIAGHTDSIGDPAYNQKLSLARAQSLIAALVKRGVAPERLVAVGVGEAKPVASNKTLDGRALNRRVELSRTDR